MRVAITIEKFDPVLGGERYPYSIAARLRDAGHEVHVYTQPQDLPDDGFHYHWVPVSKHFSRWEFATKTARRLRLADYDVVHGWGKSVLMDIFHPGGGVHRAWQDHELRMVEDPWERRRRRLRQLGSLNQQLVLRLERRQFGPGGRHLVIAVSELVRREMQRYYGLESERVRVIHVGVDTARFNREARRRHRVATRERIGLRESELAILLLGNNWERKGLVPLVRALPAFERRVTRPYRVLVAGAGDAGRATEVAERLGVAGRLLVIGPQADPVGAYAAADLFCLPAYYDPCPSVVIEALAMGLPAVTSTTVGSGEVVTPGREGYQVDLADSELLGARLAEFADDAVRERASEAAFELGRQRPLERDFREIMAVYEEAVARRRQRAGG